ncbi:YceI family protein [Kordiimonas sp. SCSIO 12610]|uniref:YceI family protein n=1 Tax=Kordiimonas sp. SCSIO 12610 TaxID=2829597 RepID=UPI0021091500|nr:YceI family protein [Kordiimonas sp. SCSIO 12610]UTW56706.1 YceI family protein [Kordiimonas sp. SCSIO 12610]
MKHFITGAALAAAILTNPVVADKETYQIDTSGAHAAVQFKIKHLGYSWLVGRFNTFDGTFAYDPANPSDANVSVTIKTDSLDSNHAERDKHLRSGDFLNVSKFPEAKFESTRVTINGEGEGTIYGNLTLHGVTKEVAIDAKLVGRGEDPWGGYRAGFEGTTTIALKDFGIDFNLGPASTHVDLSLFVEGIRQ